MDVRVLGPDGARRDWHRHRRDQSCDPALTHLTLSASEFLLTTQASWRVSRDPLRETIHTLFHTRRPHWPEKSPHGLSRAARGRSQSAHGRSQSSRDANGDAYRPDAAATS